MGRKEITQREEQLVCQQYAERWTIRKIAAYASMSQTTVMAILKRNGIELRGRKTITDDKELLVVQMYLDGYTIKDIITKSGVKSEQTIYRILRDKNIKLKAII